MDEIKNDIQKKILRWFVHVMWTTEENIPKKMLHKKMEDKKIKRKTQNKMDIPNYETTMNEIL